MKFKLIASVLVLVVALTGVLGATSAYFSDYETSNGNTFTAGSLDLKVATGNSSEFSDGNFQLINGWQIEPNEVGVVPARQPRGNVKIKNTGNTNGWLSITNITIVNDENGSTEAEDKYDSTDGGELGEFLNLRLFIDKDGDGSIDTEDVVLYNGIINNLNDETKWAKSPTDIMELKGNEEVKIVAIITDWWSKGYDDNKAQTDKVTVDLTFRLNQSKAYVNPGDAPSYKNY